MYVCVCVCVCVCMYVCMYVWADNASSRMNTITPRDQFKPITIRENLMENIIKWLKTVSSKFQDFFFWKIFFIATLIIFTITYTYINYNSKTIT